jgi:alcohol dehydrogenase class IV
MPNIFLSPQKIMSGSGALEASADIFKIMGKKALIVSDAMMKKLGNIEKVESVLKSAGVSYSIYAEVNSEPTDIIVNNGVEQYKQENCDFLVALGGGSPIDTMKAIGMIATCGGTPADYFQKTVTERLPNMVAIPTTAGTGSEVTQFTIITDTKTKVKMLLKGPALIPSLAIVDPQFTMTAPPNVTAATGIDALCHAVESYTSKKAQPMSDIFALSATNRIFRNLLKAYDTPEDMNAREQMSLAATEAGIAFNNSSVTMIHGMSRPIGALFHVPHGLSNAMLLETCLKFMVDGAVARFADIARYCGMCGSDLSDVDAANLLIQKTQSLLKHLKIPTLKEYGIDKAVFDKNINKMANDAFASGSPSNTCKQITVEDMEMLYKEMWRD